ncbi:hypothetical protein L916_19507 [Phytophthora nicotianae]|uniref:Uncharacterized protein n=1 Tax=Phytophthora nicotianae TaxID=4792 RepID=W2I0F6_PHYNI|nr:hypothetical protein L916_19507 [Phytophthora nicotianae]
MQIRYAIAWAMSTLSRTKVVLPVKSRSVPCTVHRCAILESVKPLRE